MALTLGDNFSYGGSKPLDARLKYSTLADMKTVADSTMYDGCMAYCVATDKTYQWKSTNTVDTDTGKWREFTTGTTITIDSALSDSSTNPVQNKVVKSALDGKVDTVSGKGLSTNDYDDAEKAKVGKAYLTDDTAFTAIDDADYIPVYDTSDTAKKKTLWSNIKSVLKTYFDTLYSTVRSRGTPASGGTDLSLVNTGDMYTWNAKQNALTAGTNIAISNDNIISTTSTYTMRYSTQEQVVGTWIDGKPLYQKTVAIVIPTPSAEGQFSENIYNLNLDIDICMHIEGYFTDPNTKGFNIFNRPYSNLPIVAFINSNNNLAVQNYSLTAAGRIGHITIQYTKTTD